MRHIPSLYLLNNDKGRAIYTGELIAKDDIIEVCPIILIPEDQKEVIHKTILHDYYFIWPKGGIAIALGYGSLYNHSPTPNAKVIFDVEGSEISIEAIRDINVSEEILIDYTDGSEHHPLWFEIK